MSKWALENTLLGHAMGKSLSTIAKTIIVRGLWFIFRALSLSYGQLCSLLVT